MKKQPEKKDQPQVGNERNEAPGKSMPKIGTTLRYFLISFAVFLLIILLGGTFFKPNLPENVEIREGALVKNTELAIKPGEAYIYNYNFNNTNNTLTFFTRAGNGCTTIEVKEAMNRTAVCVDRHGNDKSGSNASFEIPYIIMFKPWMLAVTEDWKWTTTAVVYVVNGDVELGNATYTTTGEEHIFGRESYVVRITSGNDAITDWIDKEKRVLIKEEGVAYEIRLLAAPFQLNSTD